MEMLPDMGRLQPQARELEEAVLGALMLEKDAYSIVSEILKPECFYEKAHEKIYAAIVDLREPASRGYAYRNGAIEETGRIGGCRRTVLYLSTYQQGGQQRPYRVSRPVSSPRNIWRGS